MRYHLLRAAMIGGLLLRFSCQDTCADEAAELMTKAKAMQRESRELLERGHADEGRELEKKSNELLDRAVKLLAEQRAGSSENGAQSQNGALHSEIQHLKERIQDLDAAQQQAFISHASEAELNVLSHKRLALEQELERQETFQKHPPEFRAQIEKLEIAQRRLKHIRIAAENLNSAEMHDMAHALKRRADDMERDIQNAKAELGRKLHGDKPAESDRMDDVRRLKMENEELRQQMKKLTEVVERLSQAQAE